MMDVDVGMERTWCSRTANRCSQPRVLTLLWLLEKRCWNNRIGNSLGGTSVSAKDALKYVDTKRPSYIPPYNQPHKTFKKQFQSPNMRARVEWRAYQTNHNRNERSWTGDLVRPSLRRWSQNLVMGADNFKEGESSEEAGLLASLDAHPLSPP